MSAAANLTCPSSSHRAVRGSLLLWLLPVLLASFAGCASGGSAVNTGPELAAGAGELKSGQCPEITVTGYSGKIHGSPDGTNVCAYRGIQYATADRWQPPKGQAMQNGGTSWPYWFGSVCPQTVPGLNQFVGEEQCLFLNAWAPAGTQPTDKKPVLVFIHGGAFVFGSGDNIVQHPYSGRYFAGTEDVILVTFNYRLGALGTLYQNETTSGNFGLQDQQAALAWVQSYIHLFGGDPDKVTLFGESAGAMSVGLHLMSTPSGQSREWPFRAAIMESNPLGIPYKGAQDAQAIRDALVKILKAQGHDLNSKASEIVKAQGLATKQAPPHSGHLGEILAWAPTLDSKTVLSQPISGTLPLPTVLGTNRDEGTLFAALMKAGDKDLFTKQGYEGLLGTIFGQDKVASIEAFPRYAPAGDDKDKNAGQLANVVGDYLFTCANAILAGRSVPPQVGPYVYQFTHVPAHNLWGALAPACAKEVCHGAELAFVFHDESKLSQQELSLSASMAGYWSTFATQLTPGSAPVSWPVFDTGNYLDLDLQIAAKSSAALLSQANCDFWQQQIGYGTDAFAATPFLQLSN